MIRVVGIETSCDDTCVAILDGMDCVADVILSQDHTKFGGVLPEYAARNHGVSLPKIIESLENEIKPVDVVAVTYAPGLLGSLMVGTSYSKALAYNLKKPIIGVHHIEGHILAAQYELGLHFPYGALVVSGGHTILAIAHDLGKYELLGRSLDDAVGECFDKVARCLGLQQPGGPEIERLAITGKNCIKLPVTLHGDNSCNFSFSGLKTATIRAQGRPEDIAASFQHTVAMILAERLQNAIQLRPDVCTWAIVGGVARNRYILEYVKSNLDEAKYAIVTPSLRLCTDNAVMIAYTGLQYAKRGIYSHTVEPKSDLRIDRISLTS